MEVSEIAKLLKDPMWRISHLYEIKLTDGNIIPYKPRKFQEELHRACYCEGKRRFLIPKSRRQGCSTAIGVMMADMAAFEEGWKLALVDRTLGDAKEKLTDIVKVALDSLKRKLPGLFEISYFQSRIIVKMTGRRASEIVGGKYFRGSGLGFAHISELGTIATSEPKRAAEIVNGTFPAAKDGFIFVETTVRGGKRGVFYENVMNALSVPEEERGDKDFHVVFLPWWSDENNKSKGGEAINAATESYFETLRSKSGIVVTEEQKRWWQQAKRQHGVSMNEEYPSTLEESFEVPMEGAILEAVLDKAVQEGAFRKLAYDATKPCYCTWDLGAPLNTINLVFQLDGPFINVLELDSGSHASERVAERVTRLKSKYPTLQANFLPHDGGYMTDTGMTQAQMWQEAGLPGIQLLPKSKDKWIGINYLLGMFDLFRFDVEGTGRACSYWLSYRCKPEVNEGGVFKSEIVHDNASHWADPLRYVAEAKMNNLLVQGPTIQDYKAGITCTFGKYHRERNIGHNWRGRFERTSRI